jgi:hypothetical protein
MLPSLLVNYSCGRKKSRVWEANKCKTKEDRANNFLFLEKYTECRFTSTCFEQNITQVAALNIDTVMYPLSVVVHDLENHFRCNGINFLSYRLLQSFQSLGTFVNLGFEVAPE